MKKIIRVVSGLSTYKMRFKANTYFGIFPLIIFKTDDKDMNEQRQSLESMSFFEDFSNISYESMRGKIKYYTLNYNRFFTCSQVVANKATLKRRRGLNLNSFYIPRNSCRMFNTRSRICNNVDTIA